MKTLIANFLFILITLYFTKTNIYSTHVIGSELSYECMGSYTYKISVKVYLDCDSGAVSYDNPLRITVFNGDPSPSYIDVFEIPFSDITFLPFVSPDTNWVPSGYFCAWVVNYTSTITLTPSSSGYIFAYQRCCRTNTIVNIIDPANTGLTVFERVPSSDLCNNSPSFNVDPPVVLCVNRPMTFDCSATDPDGDSLVYHLCSPYNGATPTDPQPYITSFPPFDPIVFTPPYSATNPINGSPALSIDPLSGIATITPTVLGNFVIGVCCDEYRGGVLIGSHLRDFRYSVTACPYGIGIQNYESIYCEIYPNPTKDFVQFKSDQEFDVMVFDMVGKLVYQSTTANQLQTISTIEWTSGVYNFRAYSSNGISTGKLIKP